MKKFDLYNRIEKQGFKGIDVDLETSLQEYNFIAQVREKELFIYFINYNKRIDWGYFSFIDIDAAINEDWFDKNSFLSFIGLTEKQWLKLDYIQKTFDLFQYYGPENFGFSLYGEGSFLQFARSFKKKE